MDTVFIEFYSYECSELIGLLPPLSASGSIPISLVQNLYGFDINCTVL